MFRVKIHDREPAEAILKERIVPAMSGAPGFVAGYWVNTGDVGRSMVVYESEEAAKSAAEGADPPEDLVTVESIEFGEVVAHA